MKFRVVLTVIWLLALLAAIVIVEAYFVRTTATGVPFLLPSDRPAMYKVLGAIYGGNIGVVLAAWFTKPFRLRSQDPAGAFAGKLAIALTGAYNLLLLYLIAQGHFAQQDSAQIVLDRVKAIGGTLAFLVAPVNAYAFGSRSMTQI